MRRFLVALFATALVACGSSAPTDGTPPPPPPAATVATVTVSPGTASLAAAQTVQLTATPKDSVGNSLSGQAVSWLATPTSVATVSSSGLVTAVSAGTAIVTATAGGKSGIATITASGTTDAATISATGGTVVGDHGNVTLDFPVGALSASTPILVTPLAPVLPAGFRYMGTPYELGPTGTQFAEPVVLTMPYSPSSLPAGTEQSLLRIYTLVGSTWQQVSTTNVDTVAHTVSALISHFSQYVTCDWPCIANAASISVDGFNSEFSMSAGTTYHAAVRVREWGYTGPATLSFVGLPTGITGSVSGSAGADGSPVTLNFAALPTVPGGIYAFEVHATGPGLPDAFLTAHVQVIGQAYNFTATPLGVTVAQGATATSALGFERLGAFSGTLALTAEGLPAGVTASFSPASVTGNSSTVTFTATSAASLGGAVVTLRSRTPGFADATVGINLFVNPSNAPGFTLAGTPPSVSLAPGATASTGIKVTRTNSFTGAITYTTPNLPAGVTASIAPTAVADSMVISITAAPSLAFGAYTVTVTGTSGAIIQSAAIGVGVAAPGHLAVHLDYSVCPAGTRPIWVAYQDGTGAYNHVSSTTDIYDFTLALPIGSLAVVTSSPFLTAITYGTQAELAAFAGQVHCNSVGVGKSINISDVSAPYDANISIGGALGTISYPSDAGHSHVFGVALGPQNAIGFRIAPTPSLIFRRNQDIADQGTMDVFDFSSAEAVTPPSAQISGMSPTFVENLYSDGAPSCLFTPIFQTGSYGNTIYGLPSTVQHAGDLYQLVAAAAGNVTAVSLFHTFGAQTLTTGPAISSSAVNSITSVPYRRLAASLSLNGYRSVTLSYNDLSNVNFSLTTTADYAGGSFATISTPDLSNVDGYLTAWEPSGSVRFTLVARSFDLVLLGQPCSDGFKYFLAQATGTQ